MEQANQPAGSGPDSGDEAASAAPQEAFDGPEDAPEAEPTTAASPGHEAAAPAGGPRGYADWRPDPFGRAELRRFFLGRPTSVVRNGDHESYDPPTDEPAPDQPPAAEVVDHTPATAPEGTWVRGDDHAVPVAGGAATAPTPPPPPAPAAAPAGPPGPTDISVGPPPEEPSGGRLGGLLGRRRRHQE